ncbi:hypothetical protein ER308_06295 [Egibacter rhizosphaerae]|uniref:DUF5317 domain-containing protein n=1 Tax=Egibacter rhizosphaerae TaxID=1670831 RepID=A0A411YDD4_9ACTN|nr:DUF5317 domain-containing protein [Egibacter rhizosphaerae]QBI19186.1 hypothetical protein ER308_06295 [Egibacter rhizosphaerae]
MPLVLAVLVAAVLIGYARGGRLRALATLDLRRPWLLAVAVVTQLTAAATRFVGEGTVEALGPPLLAVGFAAVLLFLLANRHLPGIWLAFVGVALNTLVILANGAMPVSPRALEVVGDASAALPGGRHALLDARTQLPWLADVIPVPPLRSVVSVGDLVLAAGVGWLVVRVMGSAPPPLEGAGAPEQG